MVTKLKFSQDSVGNYRQVIISGHAGYDVHGQDLVCAAISAITNGAINFLKEANYPCKITCRDARIEIDCLAYDSSLQLSLQLMIFQLTNLAASYPRYLQIDKKTFF